MSAEEILKASERSAITNNVMGKVAFKKRSKSKSFGAIGLITLMIVVLVILFSSGNLIPAAISERLIEATDVQYADAVESKILVFQQALENGDIPANTIKRLEAQGVKVDGNNLIFRDETITASDFVEKVKSDTMLYKAFTAATYDRAAYYYDESAEKVFKKIGTNRDNYTSTSDFDAVMSGLVGKGSDINVSNVGITEKIDEKGKKYDDYEIVGEKADSGEGNAEDFVKMVASNNLDEDETAATMDATTALNNADIISKEQKSAIFFMAFMENISKMKAGEGNNSKINEAMNYLFKPQESSIVDTKTGEIIKTKGSMLESPSLYAILSGEKVDTNKVTNYASDRVLKTVENKTGNNASKETRDSVVTSTGNKTKGTIGRLLFSGETPANYDSLSAVIPTINDSLVENGFETIGGIYGGEMLVEGAVNVGRMLAKSSGSTVGDGNSVKEYAKLTSDILAMDAEIDRMNRSPFDITSPNTFLGSIVHKLAIGMSGGVTSLASSIIPSVAADDGDDEYLSVFGDCKTINSIGGVGTAGCSEVDTFDTSTLKDTFHDEGFLNFVEENTELEDGKRTIKKNSVLADFIKYNNERITPVGVMDGGILEAISKDSSSIPFISNIISLIKAWLGASEEDKAIATGKAFVNSTSNPDWEKYKYAQRYVSLARATDALRQYDGDETAYSNLKFFEGSENPVIAFLTDYYNEIANNYQH